MTRRPTTTQAATSGPHLRQLTAEDPPALRAERLDAHIGLLQAHVDRKRQGVGRRAHDLLLDLIAELTADPHARAQRLYAAAAWSLPAGSPDESVKA